MSLRGNKPLFFSGLLLSYLLVPAWLLFLYYENYGSLSGMYTLLVDTILLWPSIVFSVALGGYSLALLPLAVTGLIMYSIYRGYKPIGHE